jgi:hypothetical protein
MHTATLLPNRKVLVVGGTDTYGSLPAGAELYDPASGIWTTTGSLNTARYQHTTTLLPNGKVLVAGGVNNSGFPTDGAELYDPVSGAWTITGSLNTARYGHTATLLPSGNVLVAAGIGRSSTLTSTELYDPASGTWTTAGSLNTARYDHTTTLLPNGQLLAAGGWSGSNGDLASAEIYDVGLGFNAAWQPHVASITSPLTNNGCLKLTGSQFRGVSEASCGNTQDSASDYPLVQLRSLGNEQTLFVLCTNWSTNSFTSAPVTGLPAGWAMATMFVNGIPGTSSLLRLDAVAMPPLRLTTAAKPSGSAFQCTFTNLPGLGFTVLAATNAALPSSSWTTLGGVTEVSPGQFQFTDPQATNTPQRFYRVSSP